MYTTVLAVVPEIHWNTPLIDVAPTSVAGRFTKIESPTEKPCAAEVVRVTIPPAFTLLLMVKAVLAAVAADGKRTTLLAVSALT